MCEKLLFHWVWIGDHIPDEKIEAVAEIMCNQKGYVGAIWFLNTGHIPREMKRIGEISEGKWIDSLSMRDESEPRGTGTRLRWAPVTKRYLNLLGVEVHPLCEVFCKGQTIPVFSVDFSQRMENWSSIHSISYVSVGMAPVALIAPRIALSDVVRVKVLAWNAGFYVDFDTVLKPNIAMKLLEIDGVFCHVKEFKGLFPENDFFWVPAKDEAIGKMSNLYIEMTEPRCGSSTMLRSGMGGGEPFTVRFGGSKLPSINKQIMKSGGQGSSWGELEYNLVGCKPILNKAIEFFDANLAELAKKSAYRLFTVLKGQGISWSQLAADAKDIGYSDHAALSEAARRISATKAAGERIWDTCGFALYRKLMGSEGIALRSSKIQGSFVDEKSLAKSFYSWRDPCADDVVVLFEKIQKL